MTFFLAGLSWPCKAQLKPWHILSNFLGNALQKCCDIPGLTSSVHFSNNQLSRHVSILRTVLADNGSDGKAIRLALRDADSFGKKWSQGTDGWINTSPHFTIKLPVFDEMVSQRSFCWFIASLHQLLFDLTLRQHCSYLWERHYSHQPFNCLSPGPLPSISRAAGSCGWAVLFHMGMKVCCQPLKWDSAANFWCGRRKSYFLEYFNTLAWWS